MMSTVLGDSVRLIELREKPIWLLWFTKQTGIGQDGKPKYTKVPCMRDGSLASATDPGTWTTIPQLQGFDTTYYRLGLVFTDLGDGTHLAGFDLDNARRQGQTTPQALSLIRKADTYTEITPSGAGYHLLFRLTTSDHTSFLLWLRDRWGTFWKQPDGSKVEVYAGKRFFTVTCNMFEDRQELRIVPWDELEQILTELGPRPSERIRDMVDAGAVDLRVDTKSLIDQLTQYHPTSPLFAYLKGEPPTPPKMRERNPTLIDRSMYALTIIKLAKGFGCSISETIALLASCPVTAPWLEEKGKIPGHVDGFDGYRDYRQCRRLWSVAGEGIPPTCEVFDADEPEPEADEPGPADPIAPEDIIHPASPKVLTPHIPGTEKSDAAIAKYLIDVGFEDNGGMQQTYAYDSDIDRWLCWENGWELDTDNHATVKLELDYLMHRYVNRFGTNWTDVDKTGLLSTARYDAVLRMITPRLTLRNLKKPIGHFIRTPGATWSLDSLGKASLGDTKRLYDVRKTGAEPNFGILATPLFDNLLEGLANGNREVVEWMWHWFGYCLLGDPTEDAFVVIWGPGGNGKTTLVNVLQRVFGDYAVSLDRRVLLEEGFRLHDTNRNQLRAKRLAIVTEMREKDRWEEGILKQITGGDMISARGMREDATTFKCEAGLLVVCNELPAFGRATPAIQRRFRLIGTTRMPRNPDPGLEDKIVFQESGAILGRMMQYARHVVKPDNWDISKRMKLPEVPHVMLVEARDVLSEHDTLFAWMLARTVHGQEATEEITLMDILINDFKAWMKQEMPGSINMVGGGFDEGRFKKSLQRMGCSLKNDKGGTLRKKIGATAEPAVKGIRLKTQTELDADGATDV
jgi:P4 family phage/plasmid primase-like protien